MVGQLHFASPPLRKEKRYVFFRARLNPDLAKFYHLDSGHTDTLQVLPPVYYFMEDVVAVNASAGRPYREALASRYAASPRFRRMLLIQSWFWAIPALVLAIPLTIISVIPQVPATGAYGVAWAVPFLWAVLWGLITIWWCKKEMVRERLEWESGEVPAGKGAVMRSEENSVIAA